MSARVPFSKCWQILFAALLLATLPIPSLAIAQPTQSSCQQECIAPDRGDGTIDLMAPCDYVSPNGDIIVTGGLPPTANIVIDPTLSNFINILVTPGGTLGGEIVEFDATLECPMFGTGGLSGFARTIAIPVQVEVHVGPRTPGDAVQSFDTDMRILQGEIFGDPDFDLLRVTAGTDNGLPSPGHTTLAQHPNGDFNVDSFFDVDYQVEFQGTPGSIIEGFGGITNGEVRLEQGQHFWVPEDGHKMHFPQLPDIASGWDVNANTPQLVADDWQCSGTGWVKDIHFWGSWLGGLQGNVIAFDLGIYADVPAGSDLNYSHPGELLWRRTITDFCELPIPLPNGSGWFDPITGGALPGDHQFIDQYDINLDSLDWFWQEQGTIYWLSVSAQIVDPPPLVWGWHSSAEHFNDDATWNTQTIRCPIPDNGFGTVDFPPQPCHYNSVGTIDIVDGLPPATTIESIGTLINYSNVVRIPGGTLGGEIVTFDAFLELEMTGTGALAGFNRFIPVPVAVEIHNALKHPPDPIQPFDGQLISLQGQIFGDPDFDQLFVQAGTNFGLSGPGHTTLTQLPGGLWNVDSFFDIEYRIEYQGAPGSVIDGMSGVDIEIVEMHLGGPPLDVWQELYEPPAFTQSMDMAFVITAGVSDVAPCDCVPGDADESGNISIGDAVFIINFIFGGGPSPSLPCFGDADCSCSITIGDAVYIINYIFGGGPAPCDCAAWTANCGAP